jgi:CheY-like chemotaxis protein
MVSARKQGTDVPAERRTGTHRKQPAPPLFVLIADDAEENRLLYAEHLEASNCRVEHAVDGEHALLKVLQFAPDIVVMNLSMPRLDGWEAIRQMKEHPVMKRIPVIAITGHAATESLQRAHALGADAVLTKPCTPAELHETVLEIVETRAELSGNRR